MNVNVWMWWTGDGWTDRQTDRQTYGVLLHGRQRLAPCDVPHHDAPVQRPAAQVPAVGRERQRVDRVLVPAERLHQLHARGVVHTHALVGRPDTEQTTVGRHREAHRTRLRTRVRERADTRTRLDVPQTQLCGVCEDGAV